MLLLCNCIDWVLFFVLIVVDLSFLVFNFISWSFVTSRRYFPNWRSERQTPFTSYSLEPIPLLALWTKQLAHVGTSQDILLWNYQCNFLHCFVQWIRKKLSYLLLNWPFWLDFVRRVEYIRILPRLRFMIKGEEFPVVLSPMLVKGICIAEVSEGAASQIITSIHYLLSDNK